MFWGINSGVRTTAIVARRILFGLVVAGVLGATIPSQGFAQAVRAVPYDAALRTDPSVGNIQGIQRYGRNLRTDPDQGEGYSYHVYPVTGVGPGGYGEAVYPAGGLQSASLPFDWTAGLRNVEPVIDDAGNVVGLQSGSMIRNGVDSDIQQIYHQPLIQIKMRVVEVNRSDGISVGSILEYVSRADVDQSRTSGLTANTDGMNGFENLRAISRIINADLATSVAAGTGSLVNLTSEHINLLVQALATELNADVITAPEVVTLNGQNVEFIAGEKLPFQLGQNVIQGTNNNVQQVFYKHVGTMVSVTPRIVSWGFHGEGQGLATVQANEILDWSGLIQTMLDNGITRKARIPDKKNGAYDEDIRTTLESLRGKTLIPFSSQTEILHVLNNYSRKDLQFLISLADERIIDPAVCDRCGEWNPSDCTIDLAVVVRLSEGSPTSVGDADGASLTQESNVRAVANVIQLQSGHGVVMAGLIGEREIDDSAKVPLLGDLPFVGMFFRSKATVREKTEVLIFMEAEVLDSDANVARAESAADFRLGQSYVDGHLLENPLEVGVHRIGFGTYLPPHSPGEKVFWEKYHRKIRKMRSHVSDALEP